MSTSSKTCMHLNKRKFLSSLRRLKHMWGTRRATNEQVHYRAPLKFWKHIYCSIRSRTSKDSYHKTWKTYCLAFRSNQRNLPLVPRKIGWKTQNDRKWSFSAFLKLIIPHYKILWLESKNIFKEQTGIPLNLNIKKKWCRQNRITMDHLLQIFVHTDMKSAKEAIFQQKTTKSIHSRSDHVWNPIANFSVRVQ